MIINKFKDQFYSFLSAMEFLTVLPLRAPVFSIPRSIVYFPIAGLLIGFLLVAVHYVSAFLFNKLIADAILLITLIAVSGALHLDGLADTIDGIFGGKSADDALKIMSDEHIGTFAVAGLICYLLLKFLFINQLPETVLYPGIILMCVLGRYAMAYLVVNGAPAKTDGLGNSYIGSIKLTVFLITAGITLFISIAVLGFMGMFVFLFITFFVYFLNRYFVNKIGGLTGDTIGAANEVIELSVLVLVFLFIKLLAE
ncbi:MAG: cobalamin 5'-phosphate synthase [Elusimicrobia bacterium RIFOXYA2_FULL_39_19]|nr:MAG: cobalamin 5'-phosphate synthase [Elusimicrobia bacterium RIFOXYA2_FULL_39_19]